MQNSLSLKLRTSAANRLPWLLWAPRRGSLASWMPWQLLQSIKEMLRASSITSKRNFACKLIKGTEIGTIAQFIGCTILVVGIAGCATNQVGPARPITIDEEVAWVRELLAHDLVSFYGAGLTAQGYIRNEIVTARMYIADMEYNY